MTSSNLAVDSSTDLKAHALTLRREWERVFGDGVTYQEGLSAPQQMHVRRTVADSWRRMAGSGLHPDRLRPERRLDDESLDRSQRQSSLQGALPVLRRCLGSIAHDVEHILVVADAAGYVLWTEGHGSVLDASQRIDFKPGMLWTEESVGTNAIGTAIATSRPVQIFSAEHFLSDQHPWWCSAAPVHSPHTGELLGVIDLSGPQRTAHPHSLALVQVAAALIERELALQPASPPTIDHVSVMTRHRARLISGEGASIDLSLRQAEVLVLLMMNPAGLSGDELTLMLYGDSGKRGSTRALMSRLRATTGPVLSNQPYRLAPEISSDLLELEAALRRSDVQGAVSLYTAPLLAESQVPAIEDRRREVDRAVRRACFASTPDHQWAWLQGQPGREDLDGLERFLAGASPYDHRVAVAESRHQALLREWG